MKIEALKLVCFSPTETSKAIIQGIARGINHNRIDLIDITRPDARKLSLQTSDSELLVIAVPVYMGRVPALLTDWLHSIEAQQTPTVCVVVYGNRVYDDALLELKEILKEQGCKLIAGAAYIGEHSFSGSETPIADGRPDEKDLNHAEAFGKKIDAKLQLATTVSQLEEITVPGIYPYRGITTLWCVDFIAISDKCSQCGICAEVCPMGAIDTANMNTIDKEKCITCCACIKKCPQNARTMKTGMVKDAAMRLNTLYKERKEPEIYI